MLVRTFRLVGAAAFLLAAATATSGAQIIDQQQTGVAALEIGGSTGDGSNPAYNQGWLFQGFTPSQGTSAGAGILLHATSTGESGTLTVQLWSAPPSSSGATLLAFGSTTLGAGDAYYDALWQAVAVTPGHDYQLAFFSPQFYIPLGNYGYGNNTGACSGANACSWNYNGSQTVTAPYQGNNCCTSAFREYSTGPTTTTTPEPSSMALLGTALIGLIPVVRKRLKER